jgi:SRSO17 transposase
MAAELAESAEQVQRLHQSLHHVVSMAEWSDREVLRQVREYALGVMGKQSKVTAWIVDDTGTPKKGKHSVGVARQYCGQTGKQDNCQVAVSLSVATLYASLPVAWDLYLPQEWTEDAARRKKAGVPEEVRFRTKLEIALEQIRTAVQEKVPQGMVLADPAYGNSAEFRRELESLHLSYVVGIQSNASVWAPGTDIGVALKPGKRGPRQKGQPLDPKPKPLSVKALAQILPNSCWRTVRWRQGTRNKGLSSRFAAVQISLARHGKAASALRWLLIEWPDTETEPTKYWISNLPEDTGLQTLVGIAKQRWIIERDYLELKQELGLGHFEGRSWRGFHHHATLCIAAYGFLVAERSLFPPSDPVHHPRLRHRNAKFPPRGAPPLATP